MKELFVSYELAKLLKDIGLDEPCFGYYTPMKKWMMEGNKFNPEPHFHGCNWANSDNTFYFMYKQNSFGDRDAVVKNSGFTKAIHNIAVPLYQQVVNWLRQIHEIEIIILTDDTFHENQFEFSVYKTWSNKRLLHDNKFDTYNEALDEAIKEALKIIR